MRILLDMDGVLVNFNKGVCKAHGADYEKVWETWPIGKSNETDMETRLGISALDFYVGIEKDPNFWSNLEPFPWTDELYNRLTEIAPVTLCTKPTRDPNCLRGKMEWIQKWRGSDFRDYIITPHKELLAKAGHVLIDDSEKNILKYRAEDGHGIIFPSRTNQRYYLEKMAVDVVVAETKKLFGK